MLEPILLLGLSAAVLIIGIYELKLGHCILRSRIKRSDSPIFYWFEVAVSFGLSCFWGYSAILQLVDIINRS
jgi:hypothetical protein